MMMMNMGNFTLPLRGAQAAIACIIMGFTAYVSNWWSKYWRDMAPAEINFLLFSSVWTLISLVYLVGTTVPQLRLGRFANRYAALAIEALTMAFWLRGFVALAVFLSARVCFGNVCNVAKAGVGFSALQWLLFGGTTVYSAIFVFRTHRMAARQTDKQIDDEESISPKF
jgi:hypothetical protein